MDKEKIVAGRKAVDAYREAHHQLHSKPWHRGIPEEHTPLLETMLVELKKQGFDSIKQFFDANNAFVAQALEEAYQRVGECNQCGKCGCEGCRYYQGNGVCAIYESRKQTCIDYPTLRELVLVGVPMECDYSVEKIKEPSIALEWV